MNLGHYSEDEHLHGDFSFTCYSMFFVVVVIFSGFLFLLVHHFIMAIPEPSIKVIGYQIVIDRMTTSFCLPFEVWG